MDSFDILQVSLLEKNLFLLSDYHLRLQYQYSLMYEPCDQ